MHARCLFNKSDVAMIVFKSLDEVNIKEKTAVAMGNFDGMHIGHQALVRMMVQGAARGGLKSAVFTFTNNPKKVLYKDSAIKSILSLDDKAGFIEAQGVDYLLSVTFDDNTRYLAPKEYIQKFLLEGLNMEAAYCGFDYRFGKCAEGDAAMLMAIGGTLGFNVLVLEPCTVDGKVVSSSLIREYISAGDMERCRAFLGRNYKTSGEVVAGNRLGRTIGFPTLNILIDEDMLTPADGVYVTVCQIGDSRHCSITNVGIRPTVGDGKKSIETHLFDVDGDLYGRRISVEFLKMIRKECRFDTLDALAFQIRRDCEIARGYHSATFGRK